jgi:hypothetical protein
MACNVLYYAFTFNLHLQAPKLKAKINTEISSTFTGLVWSGLVWSGLVF